MTRKAIAQAPEPEPEFGEPAGASEPVEPARPVSGVASGSLGTGANLDDTQVMRTEDLRAAAPAWLAEDLEESAASPADDAPAPVIDASQPNWTPPTRVVPVPLAHPRPRPFRTVAGTRTPILAGVVTLVLLLLVGGLGMISELSFDANGNAPTAPGFGVATDAPRRDTPQPKAQEAGKGPGHCHGHGKHCGGANED